MNNVESCFCVKPIVLYWSKTYFCVWIGHCRPECLVSQSTTRRQWWWITLDSLLYNVGRPIDGFSAPSGISFLRGFFAFQFVVKTLKCHKLNSEGLRLMQNCIKKTVCYFSFWVVSIIPKMRSFVVTRRNNLQKWLGRRSGLRVLLSFRLTFVIKTVHFFTFSIFLFNLNILLILQFVFELFEKNLLSFQKSSQLHQSYTVKLKIFYRILIIYGLFSNQIFFQLKIFFI